MTTTLSPEDATTHSKKTAALLRSTADKLEAGEVKSLIIVSIEEGMLCQSILSKSDNAFIHLHMIATTMLNKMHLQAAMRLLTATGLADK